MSEASYTPQIDGKSFAVDNEGYLLDPADWTRDVAQHIAGGEQLKMCADRWRW